LCSIDAPMDCNFTSDHMLSQTRCLKEPGEHHRFPSVQGA
jgi:hypothetical protein